MLDKRESFFAFECSKFGAFKRMETHLAKTIDLEELHDDIKILFLAYIS